MTIVADSYTHVVGVDTHAKNHTYCIIHASTGRKIATREFPTHHAGLARAITWISRNTHGNITDTLISVEGTGSYGARLTRTLLKTGYRVVEAPAPVHARGQSKNDTNDAHIAATTMLARETNELADARTGDLHECLKVLLAARERMTTEKTRAMNALTALLRTSDLDFDARTKPAMKDIKTIAAWRTRNEPQHLTIARTEAVSLARRVVELHHTIRANEQQLKALVSAHAPVLLEQPGVGPYAAAIVLNTWSHHGRIRNEAAFAQLAGVAPRQVQSGCHDRHRLNRTGDRQLNRALHTVANTRMRYDQRSIAYVARRQAMNTPRAATRRLLKRYIARDLFKILNGLEIGC